MLSQLYKHLNTRTGAAVLIGVPSWIIGTALFYAVGGWKLVLAVALYDIAGAAARSR